MRAWLGIDTSNYVPSAALVGENGQVLYHGRQPLPVEHGALGLRQSDAVFCHIRQIPELMRRAFEAAEGSMLAGVGVSTQPRKAEGSYMPVFLAGKAVADSIASAVGVPIGYFSHQQGHIRAAEIGLQMPEEYIGVHLSGGTTELLRICRQGYTAEILGAPQDIAAGQWIDRTGVKLSLDFPAGRALEMLAAQTETAAPFTVTVKGMDLFFSGAETQTKQAIEKGVSKEEIARGVFVSLGLALSKAIVRAYQETGLEYVLVAGGVSANQLVKTVVTERCAKAAKRLSVAFADPLYAGDNAVGTAFLAKEARC